MENISYITIAKTNVTYAVEDPTAARLAYLNEKITELTELINDLNERVDKLEYNQSDDNSSNSSNNSNLNDNAGINVHGVTEPVNGGVNEG